MADYVLILAEGFMTSEQRARAISRELYNLQRPLLLQTPEEAHNNFARVVLHPQNGDAALLVSPKEIIYVHEQATLERLTALFPELTEEIRFALTSMAWQLRAFTFQSILPPTATIRDEEYMIKNGWIKIDPL
jgi:hypothetical protein